MSSASNNDWQEHTPTHNSVATWKRGGSAWTLGVNVASAWWDVVLPLLANKVKCSSCNSHFVSVKEYVAYVESNQGAYGNRDLEGSRLRTGWAKDEHITQVRHLYIKTWHSVDDPEKLEMDLRCGCGHMGLYVLSPNPLPRGETEAMSNEAFHQDALDASGG